MMTWQVDPFSRLATVQDATVHPKGGRICAQVFFEMWGGPVGVYHRGMSKGTLIFSSLYDTPGLPPMVQPCHARRGQ